MNGPTTTMEQELDLGTEFDISLHDLFENRAGYTIHQWMAAIKATSTLTDLTVCFSTFTQTPDNIRRIVNPLCRCISNLRLHNENHSLRKLTLVDADAYLAEETGMVNVLEQFLVAAKQFGVPCLSFLDVEDLPVQLLEKFCRGNKSLNCLTMCDVSLIGHGTTTTTTSGLSNDGPQDSAEFLSLELLHLNGLGFRNSTAATNFANMLTQMSVQYLLIGKITARKDIHSDDDDVAQTERIVSKFKWPTVDNTLTLLESCQLDHFKTALEAGTTSSVLGNFVCIDCCDYIDKNAGAKLDILASCFRCTVKLQFLFLRTKDKPKHDFFHAMATCATVLRIDMHSDGRVSEGQQVVIDEDQEHDDFSLFKDHLKDMLERGVMETHLEIMTRNRLLARIVANPSHFSPYWMVTAMPLFDNCPTGRYMLARCLPPVVPFHTLAPAVETELKKKAGTSTTAA